MELIKEKLYWLKDKVVYMCFSTDIIHGGHIAIIKKAQSLGRLVVGLLSDEAVAGYKRFPLIPFSERKEMMENITGVYRVIEQNKLSYKDNLMLLKPDIVVHGDDWKEGVQKQIRNEVIETLASYGGELVEFSYAKDKKYIELDRRMNKESAMPEMRRGRLKKLIQAKGLVTAMETHSGLTGLIVENTVVEQDGGVKQFDAMWISSL